MTTLRNRSRLGFTLIELAIVLSVIGLMSVGLWRLLSSGNQQMKDSAAAGEQVQLINATKSFLASSDGQNFLGSQCPAAGHPTGCATVAAFSLPLPLDASHAAGNSTCYATALAGMTQGQTQTWCSTLPLGFSSATTNSYGQTYRIQVGWNGPTTAPVTAPSAYSFMILTSGGDVVPDTSGGRISSQIGGDGGFVYTTDVCTSGSTSKTTACGAYGAWTTTLATYGFGTPANGGYVASQTYYASENAGTGPWLARLNIGSPSTYNTMFTTLYLGGQQMTNNTTGAADGSNILLSGNGNNVPIKITTLGTGIGAGSPGEQITVTGCAGNGKSNPQDATCTWGLQIIGDATVSNILNANIFYSNSDIRLKTDIRPMASELDNIMRLKPVAFTFKSNGVKSLGFIAQDVDKVYPQLVSHGDDEASMKSVNYEGLIAPLISAVQELKYENDDLRRQLHVQEARQQKLERELSGKKSD